MERTTNPSDSSTARDWLALASITGIGARTVHRLLEYFHTPRALLESSRDERLAAGLSAQLAAAPGQPDWRRVDVACQWLDADAGHTLLTLNDPGYPWLLRQIAAPPLLLFVAGNTGLLAKPQLGIVGSRNPSVDGRATARDFATALSRAGLIITSGMALGIDADAHEGALAGSGATVAVFGCGPDKIYPRRHGSLAARIRSAGALVSEFFPGTPPLAANFPRRNRLISGLSLGILVVEAATRSGSLITARYAGEQGREVFAIPGSIHSPQARGCHQLIRQGAKLVESGHDIVEELGPLLYAHAPCDRSECNAGELARGQTERLAGDLSMSTSDDIAGRGASNLPDEARAVLDNLGTAPASVDDLVTRSGLTADSVSSILLLLELRGLVASQPGGTYSRLRRDNT